MKSGWSKSAPWLRLLLAAGLVLTTVLAPLAAPAATYAQSTVTQTMPVVVGGSGAVLYAAPGGDALDELPAGMSLKPLGRTADTQWVEVQTPRKATGWVEADSVIAFGLERLPVTGEAPGGAATAASTAATTVVTSTAAVTPTVAPTAAPTEAPATAVPPTASPTETPTAAATATPVPATATPAPAAPAAAATTAPATGGTSSRSPRQQTAVVVSNNVAIYDMPGGEELRTLGLAERVTATLRNRTGDWVFVSASDGTSGWVPTSSLIVFGVDGLPVLEPSGASGADAEVTAAMTVTATAEATVQGTPAATDETATTGTDTATTDTAATDTAATDTAATDTATTDTATAEATAEAAAAAPSGPTAPATVTITEQRLNIRSGPGSEFRIVGKANPGAELTATGRTADNAWVQVFRADLDVPGWVSAEFVNVPDLATLPVAVGPAIEEAAPAATPEAAPAVSDAGTAATDTATTDTATTDTATSDAGATDTATPTATPTPAPAASAGAPQISAQPAGLDGQIVFQDGRGSIYVYNLQTGDVRWLVNGYEPAVSPDGTQVAFVRGGGPGNGIWVVGIDGSNARQVYGSGQLMQSPKWSPDGEYIVFSRNFSDWKCFDTEFFGCVSIFELRTKFPGIPEPFRTEIIYKFIIDGAERLELPNWGLTRVNLDGEEFRDINALDSAQAPDWNEAGIVYQAKPGLEITEDTPDGRTRSVYHDKWDWDPDWQPNGGRILYQSKEGSHWEIWSINPDGSGVVALTHPETTLVDQLPSNVAPAWSPDGQHIVYISNRRADEDAGPWRLWVMDAGGGNKRPLPIDIEIDYGFSGAQVADWTR